MKAVLSTVATFNKEEVQKEGEAIAARLQRLLPHLQVKQVTCEAPDELEWNALYQGNKAGGFAWVDNVWIRLERSADEHAVKSELFRDLPPAEIRSEVYAATKTVLDFHRIKRQYRNFHNPLTA
jgi:tetrahydrodipicolinate N-succinyltransferase